MKTAYDFDGGVVMTKKNKPVKPVLNSLDDDIAAIERMSDEEIDRELISYGIDPQNAIAKVKNTVRNQMSKWGHRGPLHEKEAVTHHASSPTRLNGKD
jgi:hypothetical protein